MFGKITIPVPRKAPVVRVGHQSHRTGAGAMGDRRLKRLNTRSARNRRAVRDSAM